MKDFQLSFITAIYLILGRFLLEFVKSNDEFHLSMSPVEREEIFGTYDVNVPEYELVQIGHSITKRDAYLNNNISLSAFGNILKLTIHRKMPTFSTDTPIWIASGTKDTSDVSFTRLDKNILTNAVEFYEDPESMAGIGIIKDKFGTIHFTIHHERDNFTVQKIPPTLHQKWQEFFHKSNNSRMKRSTEVPFLDDHYIIVKRSAGNSGNDNVEKFNIKESALPPYHGPKKISPGILIVANYKSHYGSVMELRFYQLLVYLVCFWNAVNSKFVYFNEPKIDFHIAGIIIGNNQWASPYNQYSVDPIRLEEQSLSAANALHYFLNFVKKFDSVYNLWDIAISQSDMTLTGDCKGRPCSIKGLAFVNKSCSNEPFDLYRKIGIIYDKFDFAGIKPAAHEIGHILGAKHDGTNSPCKNDGFIMSPNDHRMFRENGNFWSSCSYNDIMTELRRNNQELCWRTRPSILVEELPQIFPGYIVNFTNQCRARGFASSCNEEFITCEKLLCEGKNNRNHIDQSKLKWWQRALLNLVLYSWWSGCADAGVPYSGTLCGVNKHCINNKCVEM